MKHMDIEKLIFEKSRAGRSGNFIPHPESGFPEISGKFLRERNPLLPSVPENEVVRHFVNLSKKEMTLSKQE